MTQPTYAIPPELLRVARQRAPERANGGKGELLSGSRERLRLEGQLQELLTIDRPRALAYLRAIVLDQAERRGAGPNRWRVIARQHGVDPPVYCDTCARQQLVPGTRTTCETCEDLAARCLFHVGAAGAAGMSRRVLFAALRRECAPQTLDAKRAALVVRRLILTRALVDAEGKLGLEAPAPGIRKAKRRKSRALPPNEIVTTDRDGSPRRWVVLVVGAAAAVGT